VRVNLPPIKDQRHEPVISGRMTHTASDSQPPQDIGPKPFPLETRKSQEEVQGYLARYQEPIRYTRNGQYNHGSHPLQLLV
jgi:hypothetical protein